MSDVLLVEIVHAVTFGLPIWLGVILSILNLKQSKQTHTEVNSRMSQLLEVTKLSSHAEGFKEGSATDPPVHVVIDKLPGG